MSEKDYKFETNTMNYYEKLRQAQIFTVAVHGWGQCWLFIYKTEEIVSKFDVNNHNAI